MVQFLLTEARLSKRRILLPILMGVLVLIGSASAKGKEKPAAVQVPQPPSVPRNGILSFERKLLSSYCD